MMLKSVSFSPLVSGNAFNAVQNHSHYSMRDGGQLKVFSTFLTCPQHYPTFCLLAAKITPVGTKRCRILLSLLQQGENPAVFKSAKRLAAAAPFTQFSVNLVDEFATRNSQAVWAQSSAFIKLNSRRVNAINGKPNMSASLRDRSSPTPGSAQKYQFFRDRHAPWLLFSLCICLSAAAGSFAPQLLIGSPPAFAEALAKRAGFPTASSSRSPPSESEASHGKKVYFDYTVTGEVMTQIGDAEIGVPGDGRCLFRAVAHGACLRSGRSAPDECTQRQMADDLRNKALDELVRRRETSEWFIEGDFDAYVRRMRLPHTWGGEPELLMLSNVLKMPITVYMKDKGGIISIAEYGQEYGNDNPIRVLYHGFGHYEALQLPEDRPMSRL